MRLILLFLLLGFASGSAFAQEKKAELGLKTGLNLSILSASMNSESGFKSGLHFGFYLKTSIGKNVFFRPELYYSRQGQKDEYVIPPNGPSVGKTTTRINYLNVPLLFETGRKLSFQFGPQVGFLLSAREEGTIGNENVDGDLKDLMKSPDFSLLAGFGIQASDDIRFGVRYQMGLTPMFKKPDGAPSDFPDVKHRVFHFYCLRFLTMTTYALCTLKINAYKW